jgi:hypothetical protein
VFGLVAAEHFRLRGQRLTVQPGAAQLGAHGALGDPDPVPVEQDRGDLRGGAGRQLQAQRGRLSEQLRVRPHRADIRARARPQPGQPLSAPGP